MDAGQLREIGDVEQVATTADGTGDLPETWTLYARRRMKVEPVSAREIEVANKRYTVNTYRVTMRYDSGIHTRMRIAWRGRTLNILSVVDPDGLRVALTILAEESV